jgi:uncharacterized protein (TIGR02001 family)
VSRGASRAPAHARACPRSSVREKATQACVRIALALAVGWATPAFALDDWQFELGASTDNLSRGMDISYQQPSVHAAATWYPDSGLFAGLSAASIRAFGTPQTGAETVANLGYVWRASSEWSAQAMLADYRFMHVPFAYREDYDELVMTAGWHDQLYASVAFSPNSGFGPSRRSWTVAYDLTGRLPLAYGFSATAGIGWYDVQAELGSGYAYGNAGLSWQYRSTQFDVSYVTTHAPAQLEARLGHTLVHRWVADAIWHF